MKRTRFLNLASALMGLATLFVLLFLTLPPHHSLRADYFCPGGCYDGYNGQCYSVGDVADFPGGCQMECEYQGDVGPMWVYVGGQC